MVMIATLESFEERLPELEPILPEHYKELALYQDHIPLDPNYPAYIQRERMGCLVFVTVRKFGELIGYYIGFIENAVAPNLHYKSTVLAKTDIFYIREDHRHGGAGSMLFAKVEEEMRRRGVVAWFVGSKTHLPADKLFEGLNFDKVETYYSKLLVT